MSRKTRGYLLRLSMPNQRHVWIFVVAVVVVTSVAAAAAVASTSLPVPIGPVVAFSALALFLELASTNLSYGAIGSVVFVVHLSATILFGPVAGAIVAAVSTGLFELIAKRPALKAVFNLSQKALAVLVGGQAYLLLGGTVPFAAVDVGALPFLALSLLYFSTNSLLVATVIALSSGRSMREVWANTTQGALGYDLLASTLAILVAWCYQRFGFGGLAAAVVPVLIVRAIYGMYHRLQSQSREMLEVMVKAIEARDPYTSGHSMRVATLSRTIAQDLKLPFDQIERIYTAGLLHDVGKIHQEFAPLLRKAEALTTEEETLLRTHPVKSAELVSVISGFRGLVVDSVRGHHERWDGRGYPDGLAGDAIPLGARIIAIADTVDAMTTDRPYRRGATGEVALEELRNCKGTQFDPRLVEVAVGSVVFRALVTVPHEPLTPMLADGSMRPPSLARTSGWRAVIG